MKEVVIYGHDGRLPAAKPADIFGEPANNPAILNWSILRRCDRAE
jgi:hypothetical protein